MANKLQERMRRKYAKKVNTICEKWQAATGTELDLANINRDTLAQFIDYILYDDEICANSCRTYSAILRSAISFYEDELSLPKDWKDIMHVQDEPTTHVFLDKDEVHRLMDYYKSMKDGSRKRCVGSFLVGCYTGARHSDYGNFTDSNIVEVGGRVYLEYVSKKTKRLSRVEIINDTVRDILKAHFKLTTNAAAFNQYIREACRDCGITQDVVVFRAGVERHMSKWEDVASHTARRSFATNMYIADVPIAKIAKMMGHADPSMTLKRYVCTNDVDLTNEQMSVLA